MRSVISGMLRHNSSRLHPMLTLVPGYVLKEFGTSYLDWSC